MLEEWRKTCFDERRIKGKNHRIQLPEPFIYCREVVGSATTPAVSESVSGFRIVLSGFKGTSFSLLGDSAVSLVADQLPEWGKAGCSRVYALA
jgi:hypothetical protein